MQTTSDAAVRLALSTALNRCLVAIGDLARSKPDRLGSGDLHRQVEDFGDALRFALDDLKSVSPRKREEWE